MKNQELRQVHPQKYWLKMICQYFYYMGLGDCWYEARPFSRFQKFYPIWAIISNVYMTTFFINEMLSHFRNDLTVKEQNDLVQFSIAHLLIFAKVAVFFLRKERIRMVLERLLEGERAVFLSSNLDSQSVKTAMGYCLALAGVVWSTLLVTLVEAVQTHFKEGIPVRTEVSFFPRNSDTGFSINILRVIIELHFWYIVSVMVLIDGISVFSLTFSGFKFRRVRLYFESLGERFSNTLRTNDAETEKYWRDFIFGIKLHEDALWCAKNVQRALGDIYSVQIVESILLLVICLFKLVTIERNFTLILANLGFTVGLVVVTGAYMMDAGEITYEASLISTAIFHSGWEVVNPRVAHRTLVIVALQRSQVPVYMTAFGVTTLSYSNFITVLRSSYSFFAVMF